MKKRNRRNLKTFGSVEVLSIFTVIRFCRGIKRGESDTVIPAAALDGRNRSDSLVRINFAVFTLNYVMFDLHKVFIHP